MKLPDFIIAGFLKCGTTQLFLNLNKHPDITMSKRGGPVRPGVGGGTEMRFWGLHNWNKGIKWYKSKFVGKISGEKSPDYAGHRKAMRLMGKYASDTKLIIGIRNPTDRAYSHYRMNVQAKKVNWKFTLENCRRFKTMYLRLGRYYKHLAENVFMNIPREQVHIYIVERMKNDTTNEMSKIHEFLGADPVDFPTEIIHPSKRYSKKTGDMYKDSQEKVYKVWSRVGANFEPMEKKVRREFNIFYREQNEKLFDLLGYRIEEWV